VSTKRKFIESHWLTFAIKGIISLIAGLCIMLTGRDSVSGLTWIVGMTMVGLAIIELTNCVHRKRRNHNIGFALFLGLLEMWIAIALLVANIPGIAENDLIVLRVSLLSGYVLFASVVTIVMGFKGFDNMTDRFMWIVNGMLGCVLALVMFNGTSMLTHLKLFGAYLMINGLTDLFFGIHSKDEMAELHAERVAARTTKTTKTTKKKGAKK
jgi:uncharacterized membrane protein HdeD (DUF308 family)